jgi:hypothetical protein
MRIWSIGIYSGESPFDLRPSKHVRNPILTCADVTDFPAAFVADPFMILHDNVWFLFFEVLSAVTNQGAIGLAVSKNGIDWQYRQIVLQEPYHLSYPYVFRWHDEYYMIPETLTPKAIRLYRAAPFPDRWVWVADLLQGAFADPSPFFHHDKWWMFACGTPWTHDSLRLFSSNDLASGWSECTVSPLIKDDRRRARPAGRVIPWQGGLVRYAQDCLPIYGSKVRGFHVNNIGDAIYNEEERSAQVLTPDASGIWTGSGMHHIDAHLAKDGTWIACVDGCTDQLTDDGSFGP